MPHTQLDAVVLDLRDLAGRLGVTPPDDAALFHLAGLVLETFETGKVPATVEVEDEGSTRRKEQRTARKPRTEAQTLILFGELPLPVYVLRLPAGTVWRKAVRAMNRLVKRLTNTPSYKGAPRWNVEPDGTDWEHTLQKRFIYNADTDEFEEP